jgi:predicted RNA-binding protein YlxR (DUF448 family)
MPMRTCIGCRVCCAQGDLLRLQLEGQGRVEPAIGRRARTGRGAYVCPRRSCFDQAIKRRAFSRAFSSRNSSSNKGDAGIRVIDSSAADALWLDAAEQVRREIQLLHQMGDVPERSAASGPPHTHPRLRGLERLLFELSSAPNPPVRPTPLDRRPRSNGQGGTPTHG